LVNLYLIRHGQCHGGRSYIGRGSDPSLTLEGIKSIKKVKSSLLERVDFNAIYTSSLKRAIETKDVLFPGYISKIYRELDEVHFGDWEGLEYNYLIKNYKGEYCKWVDNPVDNRPPNGESLTDLLNRVERVVKKIKSHTTDTKEWNIALISHRGPLILILLHFLGLDLDFYWKFNMDRGSVSLLNIYENSTQVSYLNHK